MSETAPAESTGVPGLDQILGGGLPSRGIAFLVGAPGTGKTLLTQNIAFELGRRGQQTLYFSGLSESHDRLIEHVRPFEFFDEHLLADKVQILSLSAALEQGAEAAVNLVLDMARRTRSRLIVIDGLATLRGPLEQEQQVVSFLYRLGSQTGLLGALLLVTLEIDPRSENYYPELATADVVVALYLDRARVLHRRYVEVIKRRGAAPLAGLHPFTITLDGITCYPQFESLLRPVTHPFDPSARAPFGLPELDGLLGGGLTRQTTTIVAGAPGTGKTLLGLHFLAAGVARGEPGLLVGFQESPAQLLARGAMHGLEIDRAVNEGSLRLLIQPPVALDPDIVAHQLRDAVAAGGVRRVVIDAIAELERAVSPERVTDYLATLVMLLRGQQITALLTYEVKEALGFAADFSGVPISLLAENVLILRHILLRGQLHRVLAVLKMRFADHDRTIREFTIDDLGLTVLGPWESGRQALEALAAGESGSGPPAPPEPEEQQR
jgi:circadian clock protein KaiC